MYYPFTAIVKSYFGSENFPDINLSEIDFRNSHKFRGLVQTVLILKKVEILCLIGRYDEGLKLGQKSLALMQEANLERGKANSLLTLSGVYSGIS